MVLFLILVALTIIVFVLFTLIGTLHIYSDVKHDKDGKLDKYDYQKIFKKGLLFGLIVTVIIMTLIIANLDSHPS